MIPRIIPCLLLKDNSLVKTFRFSDPKYIGDPINALKIFSEKEVDELIFLDISTNSKRSGPDIKTISCLASECFMPIAYGGGIKTLEDAKKVINLGVEKVVLNSVAHINPDFVKVLSTNLGSQSIIVAMDVKKIDGCYKILINNGKNPVAKSPTIFAQEMEKMGVGELFLNSIDRDGTREGYDIKLIKELTSAVSVPVIACGGAGKLSHFKEAIQNGASAASAGSMFVFYGKFNSVLINYPDRNELESLFAGSNTL
ncbi:MAG: imidazole glycerol phosphate synthase subunit HisF [Candidatus Riflebacteria bacterium]|nr:imidazole glycerol phosphate synthase subunit HisF [Candidatus Riflebacteria bacterium]